MMYIMIEASKSGKEMRYFINLMMGIVKVRHWEGSSKYEPRDFSTWKEYWESKSGDKFPCETMKCACCKKDTEPKNFVGSHVIDELHNRKYIYPLCETCNDKYGEGKLKSPEFDVKMNKCVPFILEEAIRVKD